MSAAARPWWLEAVVYQIYCDATLATVDRRLGARHGRLAAEPAADGPGARVLGGDARARVAGREQPVAQLALLLGRRIPLREVGQVLERARSKSFRKSGVVR